MTLDQRCPSFWLVGLKSGVQPACKPRPLSWPGPAMLSSAQGHVTWPAGLPMGLDLGSIEVLINAATASSTTKFSDPQGAPKPDLACRLVVEHHYFRWSCHDRYLVLCNCSNIAAPKGQNARHCINLRQTASYNWTLLQQILCIPRCPYTAVYNSYCREQERSVLSRTIVGGSQFAFPRGESIASLKSPPGRRCFCESLVGGLVGIHYLDVGMRLLFIGVRF